MLKKRFILLMFLVVSLNLFALNFSISPTRFQIDLNSKETYELTIFNNTGKPLRCITYIENIPKKKSLKSNIKIFPAKISIKPGGKRIVRFAVKDLKNLEKGNYDNLLVIKEKKPSKILKNGVRSEKLNFSLNIITEIALHIVGTKI